MSGLTASRPRQGRRASAVDADPALAEIIDMVGPFRMQLTVLAQPVRLARRGDRLPAALQQGGGNDLRPGRGTLSPRHRRLHTAPHPEDAGREACAAVACHAPRCWQCRTSPAASRAVNCRRSTRRRRFPTLSADRASREGARHRPLERRDVPDVPPRSSRRAAARRLQSAQGPMRRHSASALPSPNALRRPAKSGRPYRTVASWYLWRVLDQS
jgi:hypothetical protein